MAGGGGMTEPAQRLKHIYLTGELAGWDEPHWCADRLSEDDIEYVRFDDVAEATREAVECLNMVCHGKGSTLNYRDEVVAKLKKVIGDA